MSSFTKGTHSQIHSKVDKEKINTTFLQQVHTCYYSCQFDCSSTLRGSTDSHQLTRPLTFIYLFSLNLSPFFFNCAKSQGTVSGTAGCWQRSCGVSLQHMSQREARWETIDRNVECRRQVREEKLKAGARKRCFAFVLFVDGKQKQHCAIRTCTCRQVFSAAHPPCLRLWGCRSGEPQDLDGFLSSCNREGEKEAGGRGWAGGNKVRILFCSCQSQLDAPAHRTRNQIVAHQFFLQCKVSLSILFSVFCIQLCCSVVATQRHKTNTNPLSC